MTSILRVLEVVGVPREAPYVAEWFDSRISMTKDDIFVDILYEMVQEWEPVGGAIRLKTSEEFRDTVGTEIYYAASYYNICGNYDWRQFLVGSASDIFENTSRPKRTRFNKIKSFKIIKIICYYFYSKLHISNTTNIVSGDTTQQFN